MNIIICGAGRVGYTISKLLIQQNHSVTIIDQSSDDIQKINETLDVKAIVGIATSPIILEKANTKDADMIIAVTKNDEINMLICQIAYSLFKVPKKIARIRSQEYLDPKFSSLFNLQNRGKLFLGHGLNVYKGQIVGLHSKDNDLPVNPTKAKQLTNIRASGTDENLILVPPIKHSLEQALEFIEEDELVEVTPEAIRLRKKDFRF